MEDKLIDILTEFDVTISKLRHQFIGTMSSDWVSHSFTLVASNEGTKLTAIGHRSGKKEDTDALRQEAWDNALCQLVAKIEAAKSVS